MRRQPRLDHWLHAAARQFDARVLGLMSTHPSTPLPLARRAQAGQLGSALLLLPRHLPATGRRLQGLAHSAGVSKQAAQQWVDHCEDWGLVSRRLDPNDRRARSIHYTPTGMEWHQAYHECVQAAEQEMSQALGEEVATVLRLALEAYCQPQIEPA